VWWFVSTQLRFPHAHGQRQHGKQSGCLPGCGQQHRRHHRSGQRIRERKSVPEPADVGVRHVGLTQVIYTRAGSDLHLLPLGTLAEQKSTIPSYSAYFSDTWRWKPTVTLNYGIGYTLEMPPVEKEGRQVELVFPDGSLVHTDAFLAQRQSAALAGQAYAPILGFETTGNLGIKYPYNPFYGGISPRVSVAWNPNFRKGILHKLFGDGERV